MISIVIVNYKTPLQTRLCLRSLRRYTRTESETIVVDNGSQDESTSYLRSLPWIRLLENDAPKPTHRNGLDLGISVARGDIICILHTDTFVRREGWLGELCAGMTPEDWVLGTQDRVTMPVGTLDRIPTWWKRYKLEKRWRALGKPPKIISHCVLYRRSLFTEHGQKFDYPLCVDGAYNDCGEFIQRYCEANAMPIRFVRREDLAPLLWHFEAATLNLVTGRKLAWKRRFQTRQFYQRPDIRAILGDESLDR